MTESMPESLGVDTSLAGNKLLDNSTGVAGVDSKASAPPWLDQSILFSVPTQQDFQSVFPKGSSNFAGGVTTTDNVATGNVKDSQLRSSVVQYAKQFLGMQYRWGGSNPNTSFDCSGFTQYVLKHFGVNLPRVSFQQANYSTRTSLNGARAGDLIAWDNSTRNNGADHIALYLGNGQIMEFYRTGKPSRIRQLGKNENFWAVHITYPGER